MVPGRRRDTLALGGLLLPKEPAHDFPAIDLRIAMMERPEAQGGIARHGGVGNNLGMIPPPQR